MAKKPNWQNRIVGYGVEDSDQLLANDKNWRIHPQFQQDSLSGILDTIGWVQNVIVNKRTSPIWGQDRNVETVVDGHLRIALAITRNEQVPVTYVDLDPNEEATILASIDPIAALAVADKDQLDTLLKQVNSDDARVQELLSKLAEDVGLYKEPPTAPDAQIDRAAELQQKWQVERGQLWEIGKHRLLCGDSTNADDVARVMGGEVATLLASDPPYNVGIAYGDNVDDDKLEQEYKDFSCLWFSVWQAVSERQIVTPGYNNLASWCRYFEKPYHIGTWTKTNSMTRGHVSRFACWEPIMFYGTGWQRERAHDVFDFPVSAQNTAKGESLTPMHPCPKPLTMWIDLLTNYSEIGDIVADAFMGSGTTIVAAGQTKRIARGIELEPKYCAVILERMSAMQLEPRLVE